MMRQMPECLNRRYQALDDLIAELTASKQFSSEGTLDASTGDASVKLMCEFWNILKEDPDCNLTQAVRQKMGLTGKCSSNFQPQELSCYMASKHDCCKEKKDKNKGGCKGHDSEKGCCSSKSLSQKSSNESVALSKVLCNLNEAFTHDKQCNAIISELMEAQVQLQAQIQELEEREKEGTQLLKEADCMWGCMETAYKKKIAESMETQNTLLKQMKEIEANNTKWRKSKKDLEFQLVNIDKCYKEIKEKIQEKTNDSKCIQIEIDSFKKRLESGKKDTASIKKSFENKKIASNAKIASLSSEINRMKDLVQKQVSYREMKEQEGSKYIKEARDDLQKIYRVLLQKKLENDDIRAQKEELLQEIELLKNNALQCKDKCANKQKTVVEQIAKMDAEIAGFKTRCIRCHQCTDTSSVRKFCTDCPRCAKERDCLYKDGQCRPDSAMDCVCMNIKQKFLNNVFDNMYTVLERKAKTTPGKAVADAVLNCLKKSRNGKLNDETKQILQDFVLTTVKKNLNLTIIGGAVKTRCEMDPETYEQLMLCLKEVKITPPPKEDKGTVVKKDPCRRWGGTKECNCPKGPKSCICVKKAPPLPSDLDSCAPPQDKEDVGEVKMCPHKETASCGVDCAMHGVPSAVGTDVAAWRPAPCDDKQCTFTKSMRAAQCVLGPESLIAPNSKGCKTNISHVPNMSVLENQITCKCGSTPAKPCPCEKVTKHLKGVQNNHKNCAIFWKNSEHQSLSNYNELDKNVNESPVSQNHNKKKLKIAESNSTSGENTKTIFQKTTQNENVNFYNQSMDKDVYLGEKYFKLLMKGENNNPYIEITKLSNSPSGAITMELDEDIVKELEQNIDENQKLSISIKKTSSGYCLLDFCPTNDDVNNKIMTKKTLSGTLIFEVDKNIIDTLENNAVQEYVTRDSKTSVSIPVSMKHEDKNVLYDTKSPKNVCVSDPTKIIEHYIKEEYGKQALNLIVVKIEQGDGSVKYIDARLIEIEDGNIIVNFKLNDCNSFISNVLDKEKEVPVQLSKSGSGTYILYVTSNKPNASMEKSLSGSVIVSKKYSQMHFAEVDTTEHISGTCNIFKLSFKDLHQNITYPPAVLKSTISDNFLVVIDKEYETTCKVAIKEHISVDYGYPIELKHTTSGSYLVKFADSVENCVCNAILLRSLSGNFKICVNNVCEKRFSSQSNTKSILPVRKASSKILRDMLNNLPSIEKYPKSFKENCKTNKKSNSDSNLYNQNKLQLGNKQPFLVGNSTSLKKTSSGQYAIVLNKESKNNFINTLKNYVSSNSQGYIPMKISKFGDIIIYLNKDTDFKTDYGSLKMTPSGNIYLIVDEKYVIDGLNDKNMEKRVFIEDNADNNTQLNYENKRISTTCNALPDTNCDITKCVCADILNHCEDDTSKYRDPQCATKFKFCPSEDNEYDCKKYKCHYKPPSNFLNDLPKPSDKYPHIVIKPSPCRTREDLKRSDQALFYVTDPICPFHKDRYDTVSNELLEIYGLCNKDKKSEIEFVDDRKANELKSKKYLKKSGMDYLSYLPPQLPDFLKDFTI